MNDLGIMAPDEAPPGYADGLTCSTCGFVAKTTTGLASHVRNKHGTNADNNGYGPDPLNFGGTVELTATERKLARDLETVLAMPTMAMFALSITNPSIGTDARIIMEGTPKLVESLIVAARRAPKLRRFLHTVVEGSAWLGVGTAALAIVGPILDNHGVVSIPTLRVSDKLGGAVHETPATQAPRPSGSPAPASGPPPAARPVETVRFPPGVIPDTLAGMNRAARRAVEHDPSVRSVMPPGLTDLAAGLGVSESELEEMAKQAFGG